MLTVAEGLLSLEEDVEADGADEGRLALVGNDVDNVD